jgi:hypothetical protein
MSPALSAPYREVMADLGDERSGAGCEVELSAEVELARQASIPRKMAR